MTVAVRRAVAADDVTLAALLSSLQAHYASRFYDRLGVPHPDKINYRLAGDDLRRLAAL